MTGRKALGRIGVGYIDGLNNFRRQMRRKPLYILKSLAVLLLFVFTANAATGEDLAIHWGTALLMLASSVLVLFHARRSTQATAAGFLVAMTLVSHGIDNYFWSSVWDCGYPWPYSLKEFQGHGFIGSTTPFINQVSTVVFGISGMLGLVLLGWHVTPRFSGPPPAGAEL
jgi:hypothetical protein